MVRRHLLVRGHVQGVSYRESCADLARRSHVTGWIANHADGTVEAELQGGDAEVDRLVAWCRRGPEGAAVQEVSVTYLDPVGDRGFTVR